MTKSRQVKGKVRVNLVHGPSHAKARSRNGYQGKINERSKQSQVGSRQFEDRQGNGKVKSR